MLKFYTFISKNCGSAICKFVNNGFSTIKMIDSTHVQMLIIQEL